MASVSAFSGACPNCFQIYWYDRREVKLHEVDGRIHSCCERCLGDPNELNILNPGDGKTFFEVCPSCMGALRTIATAQVRAILDERKKSPGPRAKDPEPVRRPSHLAGPRPGGPGEWARAKREELQLQREVASKYPESISGSWERIGEEEERRLLEHSLQEEREMPQRPFSRPRPPALLLDHLTRRKMNTLIGF